jgi:carbonic anhydrase/acetyltransferase-like protein (isoleucine patch superfamily)
MGTPGKVVRQLDKAGVAGLAKTALHYQSMIERYRSGLSLTP